MKSGDEQSELFVFCIKVRNRDVEYFVKLSEHAAIRRMFTALILIDSRRGNGRVHKRTAETHWKQAKLGGESKKWDKSGALTSDKIYKDSQPVSDQSPAAKPANPIQQALEGDVTPAAPAIVTDNPAASTTVAAPAEASTSAPQIPGTGNACLDDWETAYRKERGADAVIVFDQIDEWTDECKQGTTPPQN